MKPSPLLWTSLKNPTRKLDKIQHQLTLLPIRKVYLNDSKTVRITFFFFFLTRIINDFTSVSVASYSQDTIRSQRSCKYQSQYAHHSRDFSQQTQVVENCDHRHFNGNNQSCGCSRSNHLALHNGTPRHQVPHNSYIVGKYRDR